MSNGSDASYTLAYNHCVTGIAADHDLFNTAEQITVEISTISSNYHAATFSSNCIGFNPQVLDDMGILTTAEASILEQMCRAYAVVVRAKDIIDRLGMVVESWSEYSMTYKRNPACQEYWAACEMIRKLMPELGLTPSGRAKLKTTGKPNEDDNPLVALARIA